jgi:hypothetical protein
MIAERQQFDTDYVFKNYLFFRNFHDRVILGHVKMGATHYFGYF